MPFTVKVEQYEGPLDLLLQLIEAEKLDISEISLAQVTDDYLKLIEDNPDLPPEELADFLVVASKLLLIKSKLLLPYLQLIDQDDGELNLEEQLRIYKAYLEASRVIERMVGRRRFMYVHDKLPSVEIGFSPPKRLTMPQMREMFAAVAKRLEPIVRVERQALERVVSIHDKIRQIREMFSRTKQLSFRSLVQDSSSRLEVIVSFLALLELVKQRSVKVDQSERFDDIKITRLDAGARA
ncbi:MAG: ScpA family protein [bacterium]